ncbi:hypothetical protein D9M69_241830 [compost metagenome]
MTMKRSLASAALILGLPLLAQADPGLQPRNQAQIQASGSGYNGVLSVNQAAGQYQQQSNARAIAVGDGSSASVGQRQNLQIEAPDTAMNASASIHGAAFSGGSGVVGVNQSAGAGTQQINALRISVNAAPVSLDDDMWSQTAACTQNASPADSTTGERQVVTDDQAFVGSRGVVQLNQSAGVGNRMVNTLSIRVVD